jgi:hypothetical protein
MGNRREYNFGNNIPANAGLKADLCTHTCHIRRPKHSYGRCNSYQVAFGMGDIEYNYYLGNHGYSDPDCSSLKVLGWAEEVDFWENSILCTLAIPLGCWMS